MVVDVINSVGTKFEDTSDVKTALVMTAETVFGLSTMEAVALADGIGETVFKSYQGLPQDWQEMAQGRARTEKNYRGRRYPSFGNATSYYKRLFFIECWA